MSPSGNLVPFFVLIGSEFRPLEPGFDGCSDLSFLLGERGHFGHLLFDFVGAFAAAGLRGIALGVMPGFICLFFDLGLEEVKRFVH